MHTTLNSPYGHLVRVAAGCALLMACGARTGLAVPAVPPYIVFESATGSSSKVFSIRPDGTNLQQLTDDMGFHSFPGINGAHSRLLFSRRAATGAFEGLHEATPGDSSRARLVWSGNAIRARFARHSLFRRTPSDHFLFSVDGQLHISDGRGVRPIPQPGHNVEPCFNWDERSIVFTSVRDNRFSDIFVTDVDGASTVQLTSDPLHDAYPSFSPDGRRIAFYSSREGTGDIFIMNRDGSGQRNLTPWTSDELAPMFSPDTEEIVFSSTRDGDPALFVMSSDGTNVRRLTPPGIAVGEPDWN